MKFSQVALAAQIVTLLKRLTDLVGQVDMDSVKKAKVQASLAKITTDFMDGANSDPDS
jgi:hypothetical protein